MSLTWPVIATITQKFATNPNNIQPNGHTGMDFAVAVGTPVKAAGAGTVVYADWATKLSASNPWWIAPAYAGIVVVIDHGNGLLTLYAHLSSTPLNIGNRVAQGQQIGLSGNTGLSTGPHLHFEVLGWPLAPYNGFYGRLDPTKYVVAAPVAPAPLKANQRKVGPANVNLRASASTTSKILRVIPAGSIENFTGYYNGERVSGNNLWYRDAQGFAHSLGFTTVSATGLPNTTPVAPPVVLDPKIRIVGADNTNRRAKPSTTAAVVNIIPAKSSVTFTQFVKGETVKGINIWFKDAKGYAWAGGFTSQATTGLTEEKPVVAPAPAPVVTPPTTSPVTPTTPSPAVYSFTKDFDFVEYIPAAQNNLMLSNFPTKPAKVVIHQFGTLGVDTLSSTINTFTNPNNERVASAHFVVSGKRIIQMVSLKDRAYHAGKVGNDYVGIETDPAQDAATIASTKKLLEALKAKYGYELVKTLHKDVEGNSTNCGASITLSKYDLAAPVTTPAPQPVPTPAPVPVPERTEEQIIDEIFEFLTNRLKEEFLAQR